MASAAAAALRRLAAVGRAGALLAGALAAGADLLCIGSETSQELYEQVLEGIVMAVADGTLPLGRLHDAAARTAHLATSYPARTSPADGAAGAVPSAEAIRATFEISANAQRWLADQAPAAVVQVETRTNYAVGTVPWGPGSTGSTVSVESLEAGQKVAVAGRGLDPAHEAWEVAERLRAAGHHTIVIECGWPRGGADIMTYGASLAVSEALVDLLK